MLISRFYGLSLLTALSALPGCAFVPLKSSGLNFEVGQAASADHDYLNITPSTVQATHLPEANTEQANKKYCWAGPQPSYTGNDEPSEIAEAVQSDMPPSLKAYSAANNIAKMIGYEAAKGYLAGQRLLPGTVSKTTDAGEANDAVAESLKPGTIGPFNLRSFGSALHEIFTHPAARFNAVSNDQDSSEETVSAARMVKWQQFWLGLYLYYAKYADGKFVDRFGNAISKPGLARSSAKDGEQTTSVSDADIAGAITVFIEYLADRVVPTPVWTSPTGDTPSEPQDGQNGAVPAAGAAEGHGAQQPTRHAATGRRNVGPGIAVAPQAESVIGGAGGIDNAGGTSPSIYYYPGGTTAEPTAAAVGVVETRSLDPDAGSDDNLSGLGITKTKARVIRYASDLAASEAAILSGTIGGSFGGLGVSLGAFGKFSIGDNQTLQTVIKAALSHTFARATEQASCEILARMKEPKDPDGSDIDAILNSAGLLKPADPNTAKEAAKQIKIFYLNREMLKNAKL